MGYWINADGALALPQEEDQVDEFFGYEDENRRKLFKSLALTPNGRFFAARMTMLNKLSSHKGSERIVLNAEGVNLTSLIGKPVHFTEDFTAHFGQDDEGSKTVHTFGVTLGGRIHPQDIDGSVPLDTFGVLWDDDYPKAVEVAASNKDEMGMSWEIVADPDDINVFTHPDDQADTLWIGSCDFGGTAILRRDCAAYPESYLFVAGKNGQDIKLDLSKVKRIETGELFQAGKFKFKKEAKGIAERDRRRSYSFPSLPSIGKPAPKKIKSSGTPNSSIRSTGMATFCDDCTSLYDDAIRKGDLITKDDLKSRKVFETLEAEKDKALKAATDAGEAAKIAIEALKVSKSESDLKDRRVTAQTEAIEAWEKVKGQYQEDARQTYLDAQQKILMKESTDKVIEGYEEMQKLDADEKLHTPRVASKEPFDAFRPGVRRVVSNQGEGEEFSGAGEDSNQDPGTPVQGLFTQSTEEDLKFSAGYMRNKFNPRVLRNLVHGRDRFNPTSGQRQKSV